MTTAERQVCPVSGQTVGEELANAISHGVGFILALCGLCVLVTLAAVYSNVWGIVSTSIYGSTLVLLYVASTIYHRTKSVSLKRGLKIFDHCCIYLLIAGSYTPFALVVLRGTIGWTLFGIVWTIAVFGILFKIRFTGRFKILSTLSYIFMGWVCVIAIEPLKINLSFMEFSLLVAGGLSYTIGALFYGIRKLPFNHTIFHLFVIGGSVCHYISIMSIVLTV